MNRKIINTTNAPAPIGPYNQAILANDTLYISGQIALDSDSGKLVIENITEETQQVMQNIIAILTKAELSLEHVVKCSIFLSDMGNFTAVNEVYAQYFNTNSPARECVEVSKLPKGVNVEISAIAMRN